MKEYLQPVNSKTILANLLLYNNYVDIRKRKILENLFYEQLKDNAPYLQIADKYVGYAVERDPLFAWDKENLDLIIRNKKNEDDFQEDNIKKTYNITLPEIVEKTLMSICKKIGNLTPSQLEKAFSKLYDY